MSFLSNLLTRRPKSTSAVAKDRLQILLAHERGGDGEGESDLIKQLHKEILEVISRHVAVDQEKVQIKVDRGNSVSMLEIDIEVPQDGKLKKVF
ncbi:cell division topological specificity factor MinE [Neokomagataea anthophila]|uniref:Cell division topological specificity factor n=1 Tax=Neokomagataea anthophila TaxID=2826925 RepID=A0ABS5E5N6_9PROT|nr:cell division topological specificity factor MinE [Neokomagataea anthophila]MBR0559222.1 cell division topological specificity factor MinE [Neokomagataea anthophila]